MACLWRHDSGSVRCLREIHKASARLLWVFMRTVQKEWKWTEKTAFIIRPTNIISQIYRGVTSVNIYTPKTTWTNLMEGGRDACYRLGGAKASGAVPGWGAWAVGSLARDSTLARPCRHQLLCLHAHLLFDADM